MQYQMSFVCIISSDDDIEIILYRTRVPRERLLKRHGNGESSGEDEFDKEMKADLNNTMKKLKARYTGTTIGNCWCGYQ
jgi:hypothetical protein